jgi:predicted CoA-binding protein
MTTEAERILGQAGSVLLVDWPSRDVPDTLTNAGYVVFVKSGPELDNYSISVRRSGQVDTRTIGRQPEHADLVYVHRPLGELPGLVALATTIGATAIWYQSGLARDGASDPVGCWVPPDASEAARTMVESAGLHYIDNSYIADVVRRNRP